MATMTSRTPLVLSTSNDWEPWLELIKIAAIEYDIWKYINPNQPMGAIPTLVKPVEPSPANIKANIRVLSRAPIESSNFEFYSIWRESNTIKLYSKNSIRYKSNLYIKYLI
jgi:hypothetical protein